MPTSLGPAEILVILVVALIVLGPKRLPEAGRQVGKAIAEVRKWSQGFQNEIRSTLDPDMSKPSYAQPQPGYDPPPIPIMPAETAPPAESTSTAGQGQLPGDAPIDWADEPTYTNPPAPEPAGPHGGELPRN